MPLHSGGGRHLIARSGVRPATRSTALPSPVPQRVLDGIPGFLAWLALLVSLVLALEAPYVILALASLIGLYSALRFLLAGIANFHRPAADPRLGAPGLGSPLATARRTPCPAPG